MTDIHDGEKMKTKTNLSISFSEAAVDQNTVMVQYPVTAVRLVKPNSLYLFFEDGHFARVHAEMSVRPNGDLPYLFIEDDEEVLDPESDAPANGKSWSGDIPGTDLIGGGELLQKAERTLSLTYDYSLEAFPVLHPHSRESYEVDACSGAMHRMIGEIFRHFRDFSWPSNRRLFNRIIEEGKKIGIE